ncbi:MAG: nickel-dependent lactate racemase [Promethearchaeota archaeon]
MKQSESKKLFKIPYGKSIIKINLEKFINKLKSRHIKYFIKEIIPKTPKPIKEPNKAIINSLEHPIGTEPLSKIIFLKKELKTNEKKDQTKIVLVVDDYTRKIPYKTVLPPILEYLQENGINSTDIFLLMACGTHVKPSDEQLKSMFGDIYEKYSIKISNADESIFVKIGTTKRGTPIWFNKEYLDASLRILVTDVTFHYFAGFGGDRKSIIPGLCNRKTIEANHKMLFSKNARVGILDNNPVHEDMIEGARMAEPDLVLNLCLNEKNQLFYLNAGKLDFAFKKCVEEYEKYYKIEVKEQADLLIMSQGGYPYDLNYYQSQKALQMCLNCLKPRGTLLYFTECKQGIGNNIMEEFLRKYNDKDKIFSEIKNTFRQGAHNAYFQLDFAEKYNIYLKSELSKQFVEEILRLNYLDDIDSVINNFLENTEFKNIIIYIIPFGSKIITKLLFSESKKRI